VTRGHGPDAVLVHGALGDHRQWTTIADALESRFRVTVVSRRHHWPNPMPEQDAPYTYEDHSGDLRSFLASFDRPVHLAGHSYGAGVSLLAALTEPALVRSLVLIEPPFGSLLETSGAEVEAELASRDALMTTMRSLAHAGRHDAASRALIDWVQNSDAGFDGLDAEARQGLLDNAMTIGPMFTAPPPTVTCEQLRRLEAPTLVLHGARTRIYYRLVAQRAAACLPNAALASVPDCGHMSIVENPAGVAALLGDFLVQNREGVTR
jgi:pimeloyl-ACP methyl ester carboxylesterase